MAAGADRLLPLAILVFASLAALIVVLVRLIRSGRIPLLAAGGGDAPSSTGTTSGLDS